ncbi:hypothetical protein ACT4ML_19600 [Natrinema sp. LN54]|uniref:hypothetical protein n=1 Tax=Natrinema sp. LN54 TaxID=3458705 RepID=UPI004035606B
MPLEDGTLIRVADVKSSPVVRGRESLDLRAGFLDPLQNSIDEDDDTTDNDPESRDDDK